MSWRALEDVLKPTSVVTAADLVGLGALHKLGLFVMELDVHTRLTQELQKLNSYLGEGRSVTSSHITEVRQTINDSMCKLQNTFCYAGSPLPHLPITASHWAELNS